MGPVSAVGELAVGGVVRECAPDAVVATTANAALAGSRVEQRDGSLVVGVGRAVAQEVLGLQEGVHAEFLGECACEKQGHE